MCAWLSLQLSLDQSALNQVINCCFINHLASKSLNSDLFLVFRRMNDVIAVRSIYRTFRKISDNAHGNVKGVSGCLTPGSLHKVLTVANVYGSNFMDIGAGDGKPIAAALVSGAKTAHGFELPENRANAFIFNAAMSRIAMSMFPNLSVLSCARLDFQDIEQVCRTLRSSLHCLGLLRFPE